MPDSFASLAARIEADLRRVREDVHVFGGSLVLPGSRLAGTFEALSNLDAALAEMKERAENEHRLLGLLYADYCVRTKPGGTDRGEWFTEIIHTLFPKTLSAALSSPETGQNG